MFTKFIRKFGFSLGCLAATVIFLAVCALSWIVTCGLVYLVMLCFDWTFSWGIATGVWLIIWVLNSIFKRGNKE